MASIWKLTLLFDAGGNGWSEGLYYQSQGDLPTLADIVTLASLRLRLLAPTGQMLGIRATEVDPPYRSLLYGQSAQVGPGTFVTNTPSVPWLALTCRATNVGNVHSRTFDLRGWPLANWTWDSARPEQVGNLGILNGPVTDYLTFLTNKQPALGPPAPVGNFVFLGRSALQSNRDTTRITQVVSSGKNSPWFVTFAETFSLQVGQTFQISRCRGQGTSGLNGPAVVTTVTTPGVTYGTNRIKTDGASIQYALTGWGYKLTPATWTPTTITTMRWAKRDEGRPFGLTRGRRRKGA